MNSRLLLTLAVCALGATGLPLACGTRPNATPIARTTTYALPRTPAPSAPTAHVEASSSASASSAPSASPPVDAKQLFDQAFACAWRDLDCSLERAAELYAAADDAGSESVDCLAFYYGLAAPKDLKRARACLERQVQCPTNPSNLGSALLGPLYLAAMMFDGQGGPVETDRAKSLLKDCLWKGEGGDGDALLAEVNRRARQTRPGEPLDVCAHVAGTRMLALLCVQQRSGQEQFETRKAIKAFVGQADDRTKVLEEKATSASGGFSLSAYSLEGSLRRSVTGWNWYSHKERVSQAITRERGDLLRALVTYQPSPSANLEAAEKDLAAAYRGALGRARDTEQKEMMEEAQRDWQAYKEAEVAFVSYVLGRRFDSAAVARDVATRLTQRRTATLKAQR